MSIFVKATLPGKPKTIESKKVAHIYAAVLIFMFLCQLFTFDQFLVLLDSFWLPGGDITGHMAALMIVIFEMLAIPFLLGLKLSPLMRIVGMISSWMVPVFWLKMSLWLCLTVNAVSNLGIFGNLIEVIPGWWAVFFSIGLGVLSAWASWGLWPLKNKRKKSKNI